MTAALPLKVVPDAAPDPPLLKVTELATCDADMLAAVVTVPSAIKNSVASPPDLTNDPPVIAPLELSEVIPVSAPPVSVAVPSVNEPPVMAPLNVAATPPVKDPAFREAVPSVSVPPVSVPLKLPFTPPVSDPALSEAVPSVRVPPVIVPLKLPFTPPVNDPALS